MEGTACTDALSILAGVNAGNRRGFHFNAQMVFDELYGLQDGQRAVALAAAWPVDAANGLQRGRSHQVAQAPFMAAQRR